MKSQISHNFIIVFGFFYCAIFSFSQVNWVVTDSINIAEKDSITDFDVDGFNNIYYLKNFSELKQINYQSRKIKSYSNQSVLEDLNAQNVLQITVKSFLFDLIILDNQLNPSQDAIKFPMEANFTPTLTTLVDNNYLWGYDPVIQRLILWNYQSNTVMNKSVILNEKSANDFFDCLIYQNHKTYLFSNQKILVFDEFANLKESIPFVNHQQVKIIKNNLYYLANNAIYVMNLKDKSTQKLTLQHRADFFSINSNYLFVLNGKDVYIYQNT